jgi:hypothetical protein
MIAMTAPLMKHVDDRPQSRGVFIFGRVYVSVAGRQAFIQKRTMGDKRMWTSLQHNLTGQQ